MPPNTSRTTSMYRESSVDEPTNILASTFFIDLAKPLGERSSRLINRVAADHRLDDLDVLDLLLVHGVRIVRQHDEIRELARHDRSLERLLVRGECTVDRDDVKCFVHAD